MVKAADKMRQENQQTFNDLDYDLIKQKVTTNDFLRTQNIVKDCDFCSGKRLHEMFQYRLNVDLDKLDTELEVVRDHHSAVNGKETKLYRPSTKKTNTKAVKK